MSALERNPELQASTPAEDLGPIINCRRIPRGPSRLAWRLDLHETHVWVSKVPIFTPEEPHCNSRKTRRFSPQRKLRTFSSGTS